MRKPLIAMVATVTKWLPDKVKRMLFLTSLAAYVKDLKNPPLAALEKLNTLMLLSSNTSLLMFPIEIRSKIWADMTVKDLEEHLGRTVTFQELRKGDLNAAQKRILTSMVIDKAPKCLIYGSNSRIRKDLYKMFDNLDTALAV